jgi:hypothetical protein
MGSTGFKDSNGILFANFGSTERKIWVFEDWNQIWFEILNRVSIWTRGWHLAVSDWLIPIRVDHDCWALDLKWSERLGLTDTYSFKWFFRGRSIKI